MSQRTSSCLIRKQKQKIRFTFEELKKGEFLDGVSLLLPAVWSGLHVVCILLDEDGFRRSRAAHFQTLSSCSGFGWPAWTCCSPLH